MGGIVGRAGGQQAGDVLATRMVATQDGLGLLEVGDGCFGYIQPGGGWGWSNAGLVVGDGTSLLVDTLFDLRLTAQMLEAMAPVTASAVIGTVVNTHANGDHCYGNELVTGAEIIASTAAAEEMSDVPPALLAALLSADGEVGDLFRGFFGEFDFAPITLTLPTRTFDGRLDLEVAGRSVELVEVGPAHTKGDVLVVVPDEGVVYTGDILFIGGTPIVWAGPLSNWIAACDFILGLDVQAVVPGHGPVTDQRGVADVRDYLTFIEAEATARHEAGMDAWEAARDIARDMAGTTFSRLGESGRISVNVEAVYRELDPEHRSPDVVELFRRMAFLEQGG
jgi:glyoxylase-like metal-dependent hydrolase (beta-lactamase superfamily II)